MHDDRMRANLEVTSGALFSQRALLALVETGLSRDDAYRIVQENAQRAWDTGTPFRELLDEAHPGSTWTRSSTRPRLLLTRRRSSRSSTSCD